MSETARIIDVLKRSLKARGVTYKDVAAKVGLSEGSIKRVFAEETFTLQRLEAICAAVDVSIGELVRRASDCREGGSQYLSIEQEEVLASDLRLLACFYLLLNGRTSTEIMERMDSNERGLRQLYVKLEAARLIEMQGRMKVRMRVGPVISWRMDGPLHRAYEQQVKSEFLQSEFRRVDELLHFRSAELSDASIKILIRKLEQLTNDFAELAALDVSLPAAQKRNVALMAAFRPWVFSAFEGLRAKDR